MTRNFWRIFVTLSLLAGCSSPKPVLLRNISAITIIETNHFTTPQSSREGEILGEATIKGATCVIRLKKYPQCLLHEVRHCFEGNWHPKTESEKDC